MEFSSIDLNQMVRGFKSLLRRAVREDIHIQFSPHASDPVIRGDRGQLEQVIMNLVVNAQDAMPEGGALIIETGAVELDEEYARAHTGVTPGLYGMISVSDTGVGMDALTRERIFEPFFTTKERGKGTGLGLATVYGIIKQHGGNIWAYSEPGEGTTFKCYLPLTEEPAAEPTPQPAQDQDRGGSETVMVVEDEEAVRSLAVKVLKRRGYEVMEAEDAPSCLARLQAHEGSLDLLLTDVVMPGMNGRQLYGEIEDLYPGVKVLYMSGYTRDIITHRGVLDDGIPFIQKPFSVQGLATRVRAILEGE
jgi:CheY-like chemotaxis protein